MTNTEGEDFIQTRSAESGNRGTREMITECSIETPFKLGDLICHKTLGERDHCQDALVGRVSGFCPSRRCVRVQTMDGCYRIWLKQNVQNVDFDVGAGNYREGAR